MGEALALGRLIYGAVFLLYWGVAAYCLYLALRRPKTPQRRAIYAALVTVVFGVLPASSAYENWKEKRYKEAAYAHFKKMCTEKAGEKIYRTVENVDGLFIAKPRRRATDAELRDQFWMGDPYGYSTYEAYYPAEAYLKDRGVRTVGGSKLTPLKAYAYIEMPNPDYTDGSTVSRYLRYTLEDGYHINTVTQKPENTVVPRADAVNELKSAYAMTWQDISTQEDRQFWVAGGKLTIFDVKTNHVIAERIGYVIDPMLGRVTQGRRIWLNVNNQPHAFCPRFEHEFYKNREFATKVLKPY